MAVKVPETLAHLHYWSVQLTREASKDEVLDAFRTSSRIVPHDSLYEVALWEDMLKVQGNELFYAYMVDNQAIVVPETIDAIRALTGAEPDAETSIRDTNDSLGIGSLGL